METGSFDSLDLLHQDLYQKLLNAACIQDVPIIKYDKGLSESEIEKLFALDTPRNDSKKCGLAIVVPTPSLEANNELQKGLSTRITVEILENPSLNRDNPYGTGISINRAKEYLFCLLQGWCPSPYASGFYEPSGSLFRRNEIRDDDGNVVCLSCTMSLDACLANGQLVACPRPTVEFKELNNGKLSAEFCLTEDPGNAQVFFTLNGSYPDTNTPALNTEALTFSPSSDGTWKASKVISLSEAAHIRAIVADPTDEEKSESFLLWKYINPDGTDALAQD